jgi:endoglucanase
MLARAAWLSAIGLGLLALGCDSGKSSLAPQRGDPTDQGTDQDVGAGDDDPTPVEEHGALAVVGTQIVDEAGKAVQLKGVSSMWLNWEDSGYAEDATAIRWMRNNWKLSVVRAAMGVEPEGAYLSDPEHALEQLYTVVDNAIAAGVYVLVDFHAHKAYEHQADAVSFFSEVSAKYAGVPNVIYEPFNEPIEIDWPSLKQYHEAVVRAIRKQDKSALIVLGTPTYSQEVDQAAKDPLDGENLLYTLHYYACSHKAWLRQKADVALGMGLPLFVTEWGATAADGGLDGAVCLDEAQLWDDWLDNHGISWTAWKLDDCDDSSCVLAPGAPVDGGWTDQYLHGHGYFVRGRMQQR